MIDLKAQEQQPVCVVPKGEKMKSVYRYFGEYELAKEVLNSTLTKLPPPPWDIGNEAKTYDAIGDLYREMGNIKLATENYEEAMYLYPTSKQPRGQSL